VCCMGLFLLRIINRWEAGIRIFQSNFLRTNYSSYSSYDTNYYKYKYCSYMYYSTTLLYSVVEMPLESESSSSHATRAYYSGSGWCDDEGCSRFNTVRVVEYLQSELKYTLFRLGRSRVPAMPLGLIAWISGSGRFDDEGCSRFKTLRVVEYLQCARIVLEYKSLYSAWVGSGVESQPCHSGWIWVVPRRRVLHIIQYSTSTVRVQYCSRVLTARTGVLYTVSKFVL
jgi:hypothetical protein